MTVLGSQVFGQALMDSCEDSREGGREFGRDSQTKPLPWSKGEEKLLRQMKLWQGGLLCIYVPRFHENIIIF